jgi:hypothetical protein
MITIPLTQGLVAEVDNDCAWLRQWRWHASGHHPRTGLRYAQRSMRVGGKKIIIYMHRVILNAPDGAKVDHADGDGLNNRWANLRLCNHAQNIANANRPLGTSGYRGVTYAKRSGNWAAQITTNGSPRRGLGRFSTAADAARAYDDAAFAAWGAFARLNFPRDPRERA